MHEGAGVTKTMMTNRWLSGIGILTESPIQPPASAKLAEAMPGAAASSWQHCTDIPPSATVVAVDLDDKNGFSAIRWTLDHLVIPGPLLLVHVRPKNNLLHRSAFGLNEAVAAPNAVVDGPLEPTDAELQSIFVPISAYCTRKLVQMKGLILEDEDVGKALLEFININYVSNLVVGASARSPLTRKFRNYDVPGYLTKFAPEFCSVYVIAKGKALTIRSAQRLTSSRTAVARQRSPSLPPKSVSDCDADDSARGTRGTSVGSSERKLPPRERSKIKSAASAESLDISVHRKCPSSSFSDQSELNEQLTFGSSDMTGLTMNVSADSSESSRSPPVSSTKDVEAEIRNLRLELKQTMEMYSNACREALEAKKKAEELHEWKKEEARWVEEARLAEEAALAIAEIEKAKCRVAIEAAEAAKKLAEMEVQKRMYVELKAKREAEEKNQALMVLHQNDPRYRRYTIEEIEQATDKFAPSMKIGEGGYGPVYQGILDHTPVAIKILRPDAAQGRKQFQQEVEVLSTIRHPNMVLLLGACPEYGCLVYEYMNNGSLEDRLLRRGGTPSLPWRLRFKITAEIATALLFLHQAKPEPLVHRDLKPANILLDRNYVSKISDVGLARLVPSSVADKVTQYHMTSAAGTFCYIDPEYQQTGMLGTKSDIYSLGIVLLQIITARPPMALSHHVNRAIEKGTLAEILDPTVPDWPREEALCFAKLALQCCEMRRRDRPDLGTVVLPELIRLAEFAGNPDPISNEYDRGPYSYSSGSPSS